MAALAGAFIATLLVVALGTQRGRILPAPLRLAGVAVWALATALGISLFVLVFLQKDLNLLLLGEERAAALGLPVARLRWLLVLLAAALTGGVVALCGPVGFVGLLIPHLTRGYWGPRGATICWCARCWAAAFCWPATCWRGCSTHRPDYRWAW